MGDKAPQGQKPVQDLSAPKSDHPMVRYFLEIFAFLLVILKVPGQYGVGPAPEIREDRGPQGDGAGKYTGMPIALGAGE